MHSPIFEGAGTALVTPFDEDNSINFDRFGELIEFQIENNVDALIVCGTTGEPATYDDGEFEDIVKNAVSYINGRIPVIVGAGSNNTKSAIKKAQIADMYDADGILLVTPYYNKTSQLGLIKHYEAICGCTDLPAILYNVPSRTGMNIELNTYEQLAKIPTIVGIKEASGNISYMAQLIARYGDRFDVYSGNDDMIVPAMSLGAKGVISVASNIIPDIISDMCEFCFSNNFREATKLQIAYLDLINALFSEVNPIPVKAALKLMEKDPGHPRPPLWDLSFEKLAKLQKIMWNHGLIK